MLKKPFLFLINIYQIFISNFIKNLLGVSSSCKFDMTCSEYTKRKISEKGVFVGSLLGVKRIASCI